MKRRILLGLTGSVATVLYVKLIKELQKYGHVDVILTEKAHHFVNMKLLCDALEESDGFLYSDDDEWQYSKWKKNDPILHIELRDRASALVIAPCSANTLAKISNGICDNLLTCVARAWDANRPFIIAPAMNTHMWNHPLTEEQLKSFLRFGGNNKVVGPQSKMLACKTEGMGALANVGEISAAVGGSLQWHWPFSKSYESDIGPCGGIPVEGHPGSFLAERKNSTHTGVDLYVDVGTPVYPVEDGVVVSVEHFTGPQINMPWWLDTECVLVEGATGVICYGEVAPCVKVGDNVSPRYGNALGVVKRVIPPDRRQHPELEGWKPSMLHLEIYPHGYHHAFDGKDMGILQDPTPYLKNARWAPKKEYTA